MEANEQDELVKKILDGIRGFETVSTIIIARENYIKIGVVACVGSVVGTAGYLGVRQLIGFTKRKLREHKEDNKND